MRIQCGHTRITHVQSCTGMISSDTKDQNKSRDAMRLSIGSKYLNILITRIEQDLRRDIFPVKVVELIVKIRFITDLKTIGKGKNICHTFVVQLHHYQI